MHQNTLLDTQTPTVVVAGEGTRLFDGVPKSYRLDLVSNTASSSGIVELQYRRHR